MIRNERQYRVSSRQRQTLAEALDELLGFRTDDPLGPTNGDEDRNAQRRTRIAQASLAGQIADLDLQLHEYEALRAGAVTNLRVASLADLPDALVRARIGSGLTQQGLAERLGIKPQQVQRDEAEGYATASLQRLHQVMQALGVELEAGLELPPQRDAPLTRLRRRLMQLGLDRRVVDQRFLRDAPDNPGPSKVLELAERAGRLLGLTAAQLLGESGPLPALATTARFKAARNTAEVPLDAYARYASSIADIVLRGTASLGPTTPPPGSREVREAIEARAQLIAPALHDPLARSDVLFVAALQYLYELRIPVVPMRDPGAFHGACFTRDDRSVIVLKQVTTSSARWLSDLLHELDHVHDPSRNELRSWVELGDIASWTDAPEERHANDFAADVLFSGRAEAVLRQCLVAAGGAVQRLKSVVPRVAEQAGVPVDVLANYLAFQLSRRGVNWWATAVTFQESSTPWRQAGDLLLQQLDLASLDAVDRTALIDVLAA